MEETKDFEKMKDTSEKTVDAVDSTEKSGFGYFGNRKYKMNHGSRGRAIIFNHKRFQYYGERKGAQVDLENLKVALKKLGFEDKFIDIHEDLTADEIQSELKKVQNEDHTDSDVLMTFVLTHGGKNDIISASDKDYSVEKLWESFTADKCKSLAGKPKLFFVIACRGNLIDSGERLTKKEDVTEVDAKPIETYSIPVWSDFLYIFSTYTGYYSFRNTERGTWYIQAFCEELSKVDITKISFIDFLTGVNGCISDLEAGHPYEGSKQIPTFSSTLTKQLYFK